MRKLLFFLLIIFHLQAFHLKERNGELTPIAKNFLALFDVPKDLTVNQLVSYLKAEWLQENKEPWEMKGKFEDQRDCAFQILSELGCIETVHAQKSHYTYAIVLGAMAKPMKRRLDFLYEQWQRGVRFDQIVLLTGERDLNPQIESYPEELKTETELFLYLFNRHPLKETAPYLVIHTPKQKLKNGLLRRPTTASMILNWLKTNPQPGSCLAISNQPFIGCQEAVLKFYLSYDFDIEGVGPGTEDGYPTANLDLDLPKVPYPMSIYLNNFAKWLMYEHLTELQCEKLSSKDLFNSSWGNGMDPLETTYRAN